ncbi:MAG: sigma 54-interacting transcriptional regulator [Bradymonadales bacterium]|nr:sigma 54-interacting transcriptional regulator [Bradymonadales bacterium]
MSDDPSQTGDLTRTTQEIKGLPTSSARHAKVWVEVIEGPNQGKRMELTRSSLVIGSDPSCGLVLSDPTASRRHCQITLGPTGFYLYDLGSTNGTFVDGLRLGEVVLQDGVRIEVGNTALRFRAVASPLDLDSPVNRLKVPLLGTSPPMQAIVEQILKIAPTDLSVIIEGDTGTGKELVARAIHAHSQRASRPFVVFDCSAFPPSLLESELYGHEKGAFSGAIHLHKGVFERADEGTIFFDELGEMGPEFQPKFLRAIESGEIRRVGGEQTSQVDVRVIVATNRDLEQMIAAGRFRQDLFYRLAKVRLKIPPLRGRNEDIAVLVDHFLRQAGYTGRKTPVVTADALDVLSAYSWPGNVRELKNIIERAAALCEGRRITGDFLRGQLGMNAGTSASDPAFPPAAPFSSHFLPSENEVVVPLKDAKERILSDFEREYLRQLLDRHRQNVSQVAREAQIDRRHLYRLLKKHNLLDQQGEQEEPDSDG